MALSARRSILKKSLRAGCCMLLACVTDREALAQHQGVHTGGVAIHVAPSPIYHAPSSPTSIQTFHAPILAARPLAQRLPTILPAGPLSISSFRFPRRPLRPFPPVFVVFVSPALFEGPVWGSNSCAWATCDFFWPWAIAYTNVYSPGPANYVAPAYDIPLYMYGEEERDLPQLFLTDGTILNVNDYWVVDGELHFTMIEAEGAKPAEHEVPLSSLDMRKTVDVNTHRGFRFMLRDEPVEQYWRDHPEGPPPQE